MAKSITKAQEQAFIAALSMGATMENAARNAGISERTAYYRRQNPAFEARVNQARFDLFMRASSMLTGASLASVKTLVDLQQNVEIAASVRRGAARDVLALSLKFREAAVVEQRVAVLEDQLAEAR